MPALVHGFLERPKGFGSVLGFVALEGAFESLKIFRRIGDGNGEVGGIGGVEWEQRGPNGVERLDLRGGEAGIVELDAGMQRLDDLGDGEQDAGLGRSCLREESGGEEERSEECDAFHAEDPVFLTGSDGNNSIMLTQDAVVANGARQNGSGA